MRDVPGEPRLICADSVGMLQPDDAGQIAVTASHGALSGGRPDNAVPPDIYAVFFSDAGGGMDGAGIARLADLDQKGVVAGAISADSAPIGNLRALYHDGILSHVNAAATRLGGRVGMPLEGICRPSDRGGKTTARDAGPLTPRCLQTIQPHRPAVLACRMGRARTATES